MPEGKGDVNLDGEFTYADFIVLKKYLLREISLSDASIEQADVNNNGTVDSIDYTYFPRPIAIMRGDANGDLNVNSIDLAFYRSYLLGLELSYEPRYPVEPGDPYFPWEYNWDLDGDGRITSIDYGLCRQFILGLITEFPISKYIIQPPVPQPTFVIF